MAKLAIVIPIWQRPALTRRVLAWYDQLELPGVAVSIIVVGSEGETSRRLAGRHRYVEAPNELLDAKYDAGFVAALRFEPDAVALVGSDDFLTARYFAFAMQKIAWGADLVGSLDFYLADVARRRILYWEGYRGERRGEPIGAGRVFSRRILEALDWQPHAPDGAHSGYIQDDERCLSRVIAAGGDVRTVNMARIGFQYWAVKTGEEMNPVSAFEKGGRLVDITEHAWTLFRRTMGYE